MDRIKDELKLKIDLSEMEAQIFLFLIYNGKTPLTNVSNAMNISIEKTGDLLNSLIEKGLILELSREYQTFHPKFSIINAYRLLCQRKGIKFKKNIQIDNLASSLERIRESARTK